MTPRREVRVAESFFEELDQQLGSERRADGRPSSTDFVVMDLPAIVERFAVGFEDMPEVMDGVSGLRMLIGTTALVRAFVVHGIETSHGAIELIGIELDIELA